MRILLDECLPRVLGQELSEHHVRTVREMQWSGSKNGKLLALTAQEFDVFLTVDSNMRYQQNMITFAIAVVTLVTVSNRLEHILPLVPHLLEILPTIQPYTLTELTVSKPSS